MTLQLPELYAFRLGSAAEALSAQDEPDALSKFLEELTEKVNTHRPDILDAFLLGRAAARLILLAKMADTVSSHDRAKWQELWDMTEEAVLYGASQLNLPWDMVMEWINKVRQDPDRWIDPEELLNQ